MRRRFQMLVCVLGLLMAGPAIARPSAQDMPTGRLVAVVSRANPAQRYIAYFPTTYKTGSPRPVLFVMDYRGRGRVAAEVFRAAAERYGWILLSSNHTASDQDPAPSLEALRAMWNDAHDLWSIDDRRLYLAGLSGTARIATKIAAQLNGQIAGVIGAAAGLSPGMTPAELRPFLYFGTAGDEDYNYWEMRRLERDADEHDLHARVEYFSGPHHWMPPDLAGAALEWMELKAMQRGLTPIVPAVVENRWRRDYSAVATFEDHDRPRAAARRLDAMARDFAGLVPDEEIAELRATSARLTAEGRSRSEVEADERAAARHDERIANAMKTIAKAFPPGASGPAMTVPQTIEALGVKTLQAEAQRGRTEAALVARRVLAELEVQTGFYLPSEAIDLGHDSRARYYLYLAEVIDSTEPYPWFLRARVAARAGGWPEAIACLRTAVDRGFRSLDPLEHDPAFEPLRQRKDFQELVAIVRTGWQSERRQR